MDDNGDAEGSFSLLAIRRLEEGEDTGTTGSLAMGWQKVGQFEYDDDVGDDGLTATTSQPHHRNNLPVSVHVTW